MSRFFWASVLCTGAFFLSSLPTASAVTLDQAHYLSDQCDQYFQQVPSAGDAELCEAAGEGIVGASVHTRGRERGALLLIAATCYVQGALERYRLQTDPRADLHRGLELTHTALAGPLLPTVRRRGQAVQAAIERFLHAYRPS